MKLIKGHSKAYQHVNEILDELKYHTEPSKREFLSDLQGLGYVKFETSGEWPQVHNPNNPDELLNYLDGETQVKFSAKITTEEQDYIDGKRHNNITRWIAGAAAFVAASSFIWNIIQGNEVDKLKESSIKMETRIDSMQTKLLRLDSTVNKSANNDPRIQFRIRSKASPIFNHRIPKVRYPAPNQERYLK